LIDLPLTFFDSGNNEICLKDYIQKQTDLQLTDLLAQKSYDKLLSLKNKAILCDEAQNRTNFLAVTDILLAFLYDWRTTEFEMNCESHWTINKLSTTLSCFIEMMSVKEVLVSFHRRALTFPLYRCFELNERIVDDLWLVLEAGKKFILKILLEIFRNFEVNNPKYILNKLYIEDLCIWLQKSEDAKWLEILKELKETTVEFEDLGLPEIDLDDDEEEETEDQTNPATDYESIS
jgi:protein SHQ1